MILEFSNHRGDPYRQGPYARLRYSSTQLLDDATGVLIAQQEDQFWKAQSDGKRYFRIDCTSPVRLRFESEGKQSRDIGPFRDFSSLDGVTYVGSRICAFFDRQNDDWYSYDLGSHWKGFIVEHASLP